jgi:hypothetical protein
MTPNAFGNFAGLGRSAAAVRSEAEDEPRKGEHSAASARNAQGRSDYVKQSHRLNRLLTFNQRRIQAQTKSLSPPHLTFAWSNARCGRRHCPSVRSGGYRSSPRTWRVGRLLQSTPLRRNAADRRRYRRDGYGVQYCNRRVPCENQHRPFLVGHFERVPANVPSLHFAPQSCSLFQMSNSPGSTGLRA